MSGPVARAARALVAAALVTAPALGSAACGDRSAGGEPDAEAALATPGISRALAASRAERISDLRYDLLVEIPSGTGGPEPGAPDASPRATAEPVRGSVTIRFRLTGADSPLALDFEGPSGAVRNLTVNGTPAASEVVHGHLILPAARLRPGENVVTVAFLADDRTLNRGEAFLYTLLVPDRAHRAFPCFDQPDLKARFRLTVVAPSDWRVVANAPVEAATEEAAPGSSAAHGSVPAAPRSAGSQRAPEESRATAPSRTHRFAETPPIPTYLFAFAAGRFQVEEALRAGRRLRLFHRETDAERVARNREAIFDLHAEALAWMEAYTGIEYPFEKFDFVAIPAFQYNGMEHPGAILYRAENLFLEPSATRAEALGRASVIAHETAHMWFGNLVTMPWFDDVWMKEVFANFMAAKIVHPAFPEIDHDLRFVLAHHPAAYAVDRSAGANPIRQELENLSEAGSLYGAIIYRKAPVVMRQLELLVGDSTLRDGLREYLSGHAFGNAGWDDLIRILDARTRRDLTAWSRVWVEEPGRPWVRLELEPRGGRVGAARAVQHDPGGMGRVWPQRLGVVVGTADGVRHSPVLLDAPSVALEGLEGTPAPEYALPDGTGLGYGLFLLDPSSRDRLARALPTVPQAVIRATAWLSLWDEMLEGRLAPADLVEAALRLARPEEDELLVERALADLATAYWRFLPPAERARLAPRLEETLWSRMHAAASPSLKATYLDAFQATAATPTGRSRLLGLWRGDRRVPGLELSERDFTRLALAVAVREAPGWREALAAQAERIEHPERRARFAFLRPAVDADPEVRDAFFASLADPANRRREPWVVDALAYLHHPLRSESSRPYLLTSLELLEEIRRTGDIFFPERWLGATLAGHRSPEAARVVLAFLEANPELPRRSREKVLQAADLLFRAANVEPPR